MPDRSASGTFLLSMPEIAELAGVRRPVVTTWRRRHASFPAPIGGHGGKPLFDSGRVVAWLAETGRADRRVVEAELALHVLGWLGSRLPPKQLVAAVTALICLRELDGEPLVSSSEVATSGAAGNAKSHIIAQLRRRAAVIDPDDLLVRSEVAALGANGHRVAAVVDDLVEAAWDCRGAFERVLASRQRLGVAEMYVDAVTPELARLTAGLCGARERSDEIGVVRVADPAAGAGDLLVAVSSGLAEGAEAVVIGAVHDPFLARIARRRLVVHGVRRANIEIDTGDRLVQSGRRFDALVTYLPYAPKEERPRTDALVPVWQVAQDLAAESTAVVIGAADVLVGSLPPSHPTAATRARLLSSGLVEAVVHLPGGLVPFRPGYQTALWVLRREEPSPWRGRVLLADVSERELTAGLVDDLVADVITWRRTGYEPRDHARSVAAQVDVAALVSPQARLTARRPPGIRDATTGVNETVARVNDLESALERLAAVRRASVHTGVAVLEQRAAVRMARLGGLVAAGWLVALSGTRLVADDTVSAGSRAVLGVPEILDAAPVGGRTVDHVEWSARHPQAPLTEPGDVVVTMSPRLGVYVDHGGFSVVEFPARALRIQGDGREQLTPRVLAALLTAGRSGTRVPGAIRASARLDDLEIPLLAPDLVGRLDGLLEAVAERRRLAQREIDMVDELCRSAVSGLADGMLTLGG